MGLFDRLRALFVGSPESVEHSSAELAIATQDVRERRKRPRINARKGTRVLIVDDSPTILLHLRKLFASAGYQTREAADADIALRMMRSERPDLVVLDVIMPGTNGFAALRHMRKDPKVRDVPVIMMSGNEQATEEFYLMRIGADGFMKKPFTRFDVFSRIEAILDDACVPRRSAG
jgi:twitching motility two-component system response regulator PilH